MAIGNGTLGMGVPLFFLLHLLDYVQPTNLV